MMTKPPVLFAHLIFFSLFSSLLSDNPDSVIVQSREDNEEKSAQLQMADNQEKASRIPEPPRGLVVRVMRPYIIGSQIFWKEVDIRTLGKIEDVNEFFSDKKYLGPYQPDSRRTTGETVTDVKSGSTLGGNRPQYQIPQNKSREGYNNFNGNSQATNTFSPANESGANKFSNGWRNLGTGQLSTQRGTVKNITDVNNASSLGSNRTQIPQNNVRGSFNKVNGNFNKSLPATTEGNESFFKDGTQADTAPKLRKRISPDSNLFSGIVNDFTFKLVETLNLESNFVVSPLSIFIALSMCYLGSNNRTERQMEQALGMNEYAVHRERLHQGIKDLISLVTEEPSGYQLFIANGMLLGKNFAPDPKFVENIKKYYDAQVKTIDYENLQSSMEAINNWVAENTWNMIRRIIASPPGPQTRLILMNAVYFKGIWKMQFPANLTFNGNFHTLHGTSEEVQLMTLHDATFPIFRSEDHRHTFIKLPYEGDEVSMIIALPFAVNGRPLPFMSDQSLCHIRDAMVNTKLDTVVIPKFRLEYRASLREPLQELGITNIFNRNAADLRKLRKENDVFVSGIVHKAVVELSEEGTTASASTALRFVPLSMRNITNFVANHPFAFYIVHEPSGLVLFYGKVFGFGSEESVAINQRNDLRVRPKPNSQTRG